MNKSDLIKAIARQAGLSQATVRQVLGATKVALADARSKGERLPALVLAELATVPAKTVSSQATRPGRKPEAKRPTKEPQSRTSARSTTRRPASGPARESRLTPSTDKARLGTLNEATVHLVPEMHDPVTGRLDAKRVAAFYAISVKALAQAIDRPYAAIAKTPNGTKLQAPLSVWERIAAAFQRFAEPVVALRMWLNAPHPDLGDEPPMSFMLEGHSDGIIDLVVSRMLGQPG